MYKKGDKSKTLLFFLVFILFSCAQIELVESPWEQATTPFIYSVITPSEPVAVFLGQNIITDDSVFTNIYSEAKVFFCEEGKPWIELEKCSYRSGFFIDSNIVVSKGKTYQIKVEIDNSEYPLLAKTTVPKISAKLLTASYLVYDTTTWQVGDGRAWEGYFKAEWNVLPDKECGYLLYTCTGINNFIQGAEKCTSNIPDLFYPKDSADFKLYLATTDINLKKWVRNKQIQENQIFESGMLFLMLP